MKAPAPKPVAPPREGVWTRDGRWVWGGWHDAEVDRVVADLVRWRRIPGSPQQFVEWLKSHPLSGLATKMLRPAFIAKMFECDDPGDWSCITLWADSHFAGWVQRCGRPLLDHRWDDFGQWVPNGRSGGRAGAEPSINAVPDV